MQCKQGKADQACGKQATTRHKIAKPLTLRGVQRILRDSKDG
ncbi:hypothetical protein GLIP_3818 [Aliiglaciecola lipolytica E3]|uniref:Uncharacterized protein n=1 Tax=Aliiglaciecola lipolytica E3 TaxID=1127673 RepID=K6X750_9ALTE|nr:hypothetical protein GLIP_3818 [Aliiglaciecola lipolytica E3]